MPDRTSSRVEFDMRGQVCPSTLLTALREISERREAILSGEVVLSLLTDNRDCTVTIPETAAHMGYAASVRKESGYYVIEVERADRGAFL